MSYFIRKDVPGGGTSIDGGAGKFAGHVGGVKGVYPGGQWYSISKWTCCSPAGTGEVAP